MITRRAVICGSAAGAGLGLLSCGRGDKKEEKPENRNPPGAAAPPIKAVGNEIEDANFIDALGRGIDDAFGELMAPLAVGKVIEQHVVRPEQYTSNAMQYHMVEGQSSYNSVLSQSASAKARYGIYSGNGGISSTTTLENTSYSLHVMAIARRAYPERDLRRPTIDPRVVDGIRKLYASAPGRAELLRTYGDRLILGVTSASDLLIDIAFETSSSSMLQSLKKEIGLAVKGVASGKAGYDKLISSATSQTQIQARLIGIEDIVPKDYSYEEVNSVIQDFFKGSPRSSGSGSYKTVRMSDLILDGSPMTWASDQELNVRRNFTEAVQSALVEIDQILVDIEYVLRNPVQFTSEVQQRAFADEAQFKASRVLVSQRATSAWASFHDTGSTDGKLFSFSDLLGIIPKSLYRYPQKTDPVQAPTPRGRPSSGSSIVIPGPLRIRINLPSL